MFRHVLKAIAALIALPVLAQIAPVGTGGPGPYKANHLTVELVAARPEIAQGGDAQLGLVMTIEDDWHVYWVNAGDAGDPPTVTWTLPKGFTADKMQFPIPSRLPLPPLMDFGYEYEVAFPIQVHAAAKTKLGPAKLTANVNWLVCSSSGCLPGSAKMGIDLKVVPAAEAERLKAENAEASKVGAIGSALSHLPKPLPQGYTTNTIATPTQFFISLHTGKREEDGEFYPFDQNQILNASDQDGEPLTDGVRVSVARSPDLKTLPASLHGLLKLSDDEAYEIDSPVKEGPAPVSTKAAKGKGGTSSTTLGAFTAVAFAFLGGALLNLMPCVFPVLFLKALALVKTSGAERREALQHGFMYAVGIVISFWAILAALLLLRAGGSELGWGFQMQSPGFVSVLAIGVFFFSLSLAGMFDLGLSLTSAGGGLAQKEGYKGSFFTGVLATVVATPCTAPLMGPAIGFSLTQSLGVTVAIFTALALGLAAPYVLLSANPSWTRILPRPGAWMEVLKQLTAVPLFATVVWLVYLYGSLFDAEHGLYNAAFLLLGLLVVAIAGWVLQRWPAGWKGSLIALLIGACAVATPFYFRAPVIENSVWQAYSKDAISQARAQGHPVFVDFTAKWCLSCQVNERAVLNTEAVQKRFKDHNVVLLRADWTRYDPAITAELSAVGRNGVPTYVIYPADTSKQPDVLPEALSKGIVMDALDKDLK